MTKSSLSSEAESKFGKVKRCSTWSERYLTYPRLGCMQCTTTTWIYSWSWNAHQESSWTPGVYAGLFTSIRRERKAGIACWSVHSLHLKVGRRRSLGPYASPFSFVQMISCLPVFGFFTQKSSPCCLDRVGKALAVSLKSSRNHNAA